MSIKEPRIRWTVRNAGRTRIPAEEEKKGITPARHIPRDTNSTERGKCRGATPICLTGFCGFCGFVLPGHVESLAGLFIEEEKGKGYFTKGDERSHVTFQDS